MIDLRLYFWKKTKQDKLKRFSEYEDISIYALDFGVNGFTQ